MKQLDWNYIHVYDLRIIPLSFTMLNIQQAKFFINCNFWKKNKCIILSLDLFYFSSEISYILFKLQNDIKIKCFTTF